MIVIFMFVPEILWMTVYLCFLQVEIIYPTDGYDSILPNATLANLYENNGKALGIQFPEQPANFSGMWK